MATIDKEPFGLIDANGNCLSCNDPHALEIHLACFWCDHKFHAVCRDAIDDKMIDKKAMILSVQGHFSILINLTLTPRFIKKDPITL